MIHASFWRAASRFAIASLAMVWISCGGGGSSPSPQTPTYTVTFVAGTGGSLAGTTAQTVTSGGSTIPVTAVPSAGFGFANWTGGGFTTSAINPLTVSNVTSNLTISAHFTLQAYLVNFMSGTGGNLTGDTAQMVASGGSTTPVSAVPAPGYAFVNWTGTGFTTSTANPLTIANVTSNLTITANYGSLPSFNLDINALAASGLASVSSTTLDIGNIQSIFDRDLSTLARSANINPMVVQVAFTNPQTLVESRVYCSNAIGTPAYQWKVETADSQADLDSQTGTYRLAVPVTSTVSNVYSIVSISSPVTARIAKLTCQRLTGDNYVHLYEWALVSQGLPAPVITQQPQGATLTEGYPMYLSVNATAPGNPILSYQWTRNGQPISGATHSTYKVAGVLQSDAGSYAVIVSNGATTTPSASATVTVSPWDRSLAIWPNSVSSANSDPWLVRFHDRIEQMKPKVLFINFGNGRADYGPANRDNIASGPVTDPMLAQRVQAYTHVWEQATTYQPVTHPNAKPFITPVVTLVDLHDTSGHANSLAMPRRTPKGGTRPFFDVTALFGDAFNASIGLKDGNGQPINLAAAFKLGVINDVVICANQIDPDSGGATPIDQCVGMFESDCAYACYDDQFNKTTQVVNWPSPFPLPFDGVSLRITFTNIGRDIGSDGHGGTVYGFDLHGVPGHEFEYRANYFNWIPYFTKYFKRYADFDMDTKYGIGWSSLYGQTGDVYLYASPNGLGAMTVLTAPNANPPVSISNYRPVGGNTHYPPGAAHGYDYLPVATVMSSMETFMKPGSVAVPFNTTKWAYLMNDTLISDDNGGKWLTYWCQNVPGYLNDSLDDDGKPMKNWWVFWYY